MPSIDLNQCVGGGWPGSAVFKCSLGRMLPLNSVWRTVGSTFSWTTFPRATVDQGTIAQHEKVLFISVTAVGSGASDQLDHGNNRPTRRLNMYALHTSSSAYLYV